VHTPALAQSVGSRGFVVKAGILEAGSDGERQLRETHTIPLEPDRRPSWCFVVAPPNDEPYDVYSVTYPPAAPARLTGDFSGEEAAAAATFGLRTEPKHVDGVRPFCFELHAGDPLGEYRVEVFVDEMLRETLRLQVVAPAGAAR
jgi:hypothetical protein